MAHPSDLEARVAALEARMAEVAADAAAARHLAAARDRDIADLGIKVDANRAAINALGEQARAGFDRLEVRSGGLQQRVDGLEGQMRTEFAEMRGRLDATAAGVEHIVGMLTRLIEDDDQ